MVSWRVELGGRQRPEEPVETMSRPAGPPHSKGGLAWGTGPVQNHQILVPGSSIKRAPPFSTLFQV